MFDKCVTARAVTFCVSFLKGKSVIKVILVTNSGDGMPKSLEVRDGVSLEDFLEVNFDGDLDDFTISIRRDGSSFEPDMSEHLYDSDRICLAPSRVKGEL